MRYIFPSLFPSEVTQHVRYGYFLDNKMRVVVR